MQPEPGRSLELPGVILQDLSLGSPEITWMRISEVEPGKLTLKPSQEELRTSQV